MSEKLPTTIRENSPFDLWTVCLEEVKKIEKEKPILECKEINGVKKHLAPNGEISKLPEIYAKITRTPTFLKWFGDWTQKDKTKVSKVVYEDTQEPILMMHGTKENIPTETGLVPQHNDIPARDGKIFFTSIIESVLKNVDILNNGGGLFSAFLCIKNPFLGHPKDAPYLWFKDGYLTKFDAQRYYAVVTSSNQIMHLPSSLEHNPTQIK